MSSFNNDAWLQKDILFSKYIGPVKQVQLEITRQRNEHDTIRDSIQAFVSKAQESKWRKFGDVIDIISKSEIGTADDSKWDINIQLQDLESEIQRYVSQLTEKEAESTRNPSGILACVFLCSESEKKSLLIIIFCLYLYLIIYFVSSN